MGKRAFFFSFFLEKELLAFSVIFRDCDPDFSTQCVEPAITWFQRKFNVDLYDLLIAFKAARLFCPVNVQWLKPTDASVESLRAFPFLDSDEIINGLSPSYLTI